MNLTLLRQKWKKPLRWLGIIALIAIAAAIVLGILNALIADGTWSLGWYDYRYDETGCQTGSGTLFVDELRELEIDWLDGEVEVISCEDLFPSITETCRETPKEDDILRRFWEEDRQKLTIRYRKSAVFFGSSGLQNKKLTVRIPKRLFGELTVTVRTDTANLTVEGIAGDSLAIESRSGNVTLENASFRQVNIDAKKGAIGGSVSASDRITVTAKRRGIDLVALVCPAELSVAAERGDVRLSLPPDTSFRLRYSTDKGTLAGEFALQGEGEEKICGDGKCRITVQAPRGDLLLSANR